MESNQTILEDIWDIEHPEAANKLKELENEEDDET